MLPSHRVGAPFHLFHSLPFLVYLFWDTLYRFNRFYMRYRTYLNWLFSCTDSGHDDVTFRLCIRMNNSLNFLGLIFRASSTHRQWTKPLRLYVITFRGRCFINCATNRKTRRNAQNKIDWDTQWWWRCWEKAIDRTDDRPWLSAIYIYLLDVFARLCRNALWRD